MVSSSTDVASVLVVPSGSEEDDGLACLDPDTELDGEGCAIGAGKFSCCTSTLITVSVFIFFGIFEGEGLSSSASLFLFRLVWSVSGEGDFASEDLWFDTKFLNLEIDNGVRLGT